MKKVIIALWGVLIVIVGCRTAESDQVTIRSEPNVTDWHPEETFRVVEPVKKVGDLDMGRVIVKRNDGGPFSVMVIPLRDIPVGSPIKIAKVEYMHHPTMRNSFWVAR